ncbi:hypothetical protein ABZW03_10600 [Kitasatospora sp. NPDC004799]|uniref:hypothetical protein n=1 Tax=Kitasatospora sp. NPDC004799 TaxID=3154460 RepID=UPI0033A2F3E5
MAASEHNAELLDALHDLLPALVVTPNDAERLTYLVRRAHRSERADQPNRFDPAGAAPHPAHISRLLDALGQARNRPELGFGQTGPEGPTR